MRTFKHKHNYGDAGTFHLDCVYKDEVSGVDVAEEVSKWISSHNIGGTPYVNGEEVCIRGLTEMPNVIIFVNPSHAHALIKVRKEGRLEYVHLYITNSHCHNAIRQDSDTETVVYLYMWSMNNLNMFSYSEIAKYIDNVYGCDFIINVGVLQRLADVMRPKICNVFDEQQMISNFMSVTSDYEPKEESIPNTTEVIRKWVTNHHAKGTPYINEKEVDIDDLTELPNIIVFAGYKDKYMDDTSYILVKVHKNTQTEYCCLIISSNCSYIFLTMWGDEYTPTYGYFNIYEYMRNTYGDDFVTNVGVLQRLANVMRPRICSMFNEQQILSKFTVTSKSARKN